MLFFNLECNHSEATLTCQFLLILVLFNFNCEKKKKHIQTDTSNEELYRLWMRSADVIYRFKGGKNTIHSHATHNLKCKIADS